MKVLALIDHQGYVLSPLTVAPVNETDMVLLPQGLKALKRWPGKWAAMDQYRNVQCLHHRAERAYRITSLGNDE